MHWQETEDDVSEIASTLNSTAGSATDQRKRPKECKSRQPKEKSTKKLTGGPFTEIEVENDNKIIKQTSMLTLIGARKKAVIDFDS